MTDKSAYLKKLEANLEQWDAEIDKLQAQAKDAQANAQLQYEEQLRELRARRKDVMERMEQLGRSSGDAWKDMQAGVEAAWESLRGAIDKAQSRFR